MKQLHFSHINTNSKKFTVTVNFFQKETKTAPKGQYYFVKYIKEFSAIFPTIPDYFKRFPKTAEDSRRLPKIFEDRKMSEDFYRPLEHRLKVHE